MTGRFIVLEGIDGCGKGTQLKKLAAALFDRDKKQIILMTREPTGITAAGKELRRRLAQDKNPRENAALYTKLFIEDRRDHAAAIIQPALAKGIHVLCDRYKHSTVVYQRAQGEDAQKLLALHDGLPVPDLTVIIDVPPGTALERIRKSREVFEQPDFLAELRNAYLDLPELLPQEKIAIVDGTKAPEQVHASIMKEVEKII